MRQLFGGGRTEGVEAEACLMASIYKLFVQALLHLQILVTGVDEAPVIQLRLTRPLPQPWPMARSIKVPRAPVCTTTLNTTPPMCWIRTGTVLNSSTKNGSTHNEQASNLRCHRLHRLHRLHRSHGGGAGEGAWTEFLNCRAQSIASHVTRYKARGTLSGVRSRCRCRGFLVGHLGIAELCGAVRAHRRSLDARVHASRRGLPGHYRRDQRLPAGREAGLRDGFVGCHATAGRGLGRRAH